MIRWGSKVFVLQAVVLLLGVVLVAVGISHGELTEIWQKAIIVCLECIGIG